VTLPPDLPVVDHHCHLSPEGEGVGAARRFEREGGSHLFLTTHNWDHRPLRSAEDYQRQFEGMEALSRKIQAETQVRPFLVVAPYPVDLLSASDALGISEATELQLKALDLAGSWVREHRAVALGEVGWPHFPVSEAQSAAAQTVFRRALEIAHDCDCPAVVHCEDLDAEGFHRLSEQARSAGLPPERVVKHYARRYLAKDERSRITPSFLARKESLLEALNDDGPWFLETDFLDDPKRPGAVLDIATVPRRASALARDQPDRVDRLRVPFVESVHKVYGITPEAPTGARR
jgi:TatD-related deoxyribonuclease